MARPIKQGLTYFPFDVDFFNDEKIEAISGEFGIKGEIVAIKLLTAVYRNGYFIEWSEMLQMKMLKSLPSISKELLDQIISRLIKWEFFDEDLFNSEQVLTSRGIQKRYFEAMKRNRVREDLPYLLVSVAKTQVSATKTPQNVAKTPQNKNKEKESKVNENVNNTSSYNTGEVSETKNFLKGNQIQMDRLMMQHKLSREQIHEKIDEFVEKKTSWGENDWKNTSDLSRNFEFWLSKNSKTNQEGKKPRSVF